MVHLSADVGAAFIVERSVSAAIVGLQLHQLAKTAENEPSEYQHFNMG